MTFVKLVCVGGGVQHLSLLAEVDGVFFAFSKKSRSVGCYD